MFEGIINFFKKSVKKEEKQLSNSKSAAKERLHLVLMQDRANVSADFLELMKQEIIEVIKKYIEVDEAAIDVRLTNQANEDGTNGAPALYANIPIMNIKNETRKINNSNKDENITDDNKQEEQKGNEDMAEDNHEEKSNSEESKTDKVKKNKNAQEQKKDVESEKIKQEKE